MLGSRHYRKKHLSTGAAAEICIMEYKRIIVKTTEIKWFKRFENGDFDFEDKPRWGRPPLLNEEDLCTALEDEPSSSIRRFSWWTWSRTMDHCQSPEQVWLCIKKDFFANDPKLFAQSNILDGFCRERLKSSVFIRIVRRIPMMNMLRTQWRRKM